MEWFKEGFTDYLTVTHLSQTGIDSRNVTFRKLENFVQRYAISRLVLRLEDSMREAGKEKHRKHTLVYGGEHSLALFWTFEFEKQRTTSAGWMTLWPPCSRNSERRESHLNIRT